jgi:hypothetical protein
MIGSTVTVTDASGNQIAQTTTGPLGGYDVALENSTQNGTITGPLTVTITGGATICDYDNPTVAGQDCPTGNPAPNDFVVFGTQYDLPATFALRSSIPVPGNGTTAHANPLTELAILKAIESAGATAPTAAQQTQALQAVAGLVSALTGIEVADVSQVRPSNLANLGANEDPIALAIAGISASLLSQGNADLTTVINNLAALVVLGNNGQLSGTGTDLGTLVSVFARGLQTAAAASGDAALTQAASSATALANVYTSLGDATVTVPTADSAATAAATRAFVTNLATVVGEVTSATGAQGAGVDGSVGATEAFITELDAVAGLSSTNATKALTRLSDALITAAQGLEDGASVTNDADSEDGLAFVLTNTAGVLTLGATSSVWPLAAGANQVSVTATDGTANAPTAATSTNAPEATTFSLNGVTMTTTNAAGTGTAQTFTGSISNVYTAAVAAADDVAATEATDSITFSGTVTGATATAPSLSISLTTVNDPRDPTANSTRGTYTATFTFVGADAGDNLTLALSGTIGASLQGYTVTSASGSVSGTVTRNGTTDVNTLTDSNSSILTLTVTNGQVVSTDGIIGTFAEAGVQTATLNDTGVVTFTDGGILLLPSIIFVPDN